MSWRTVNSIFYCIKTRFYIIGLECKRNRIHNDDVIFTVLMASRSIHHFKSNEIPST